jgi:hypothetical protein
MNKTAIKNFAVWARNKLIADITYKASLLGVAEAGINAALPQSTKDVEFYDIGTKEPYAITGEALRQRKQLAERIAQKAKESDYKTAYRSVLEEVAYTWFNRLIAIRFMEVNDYLPSRIRVLSAESGTKLEPDLVTTPFEAELALSDYDKAEIVRLKTENQVDELFRLLFIRQCNALNAILPKLFEKTADYTELLLNVSVTDQDGVVYHLVHDIAEDDFNIEKGGQVEIIGWLYQYYNTEPKDEAFALLKKNVKITKERIPAATQLFTPDWIVRYMVENSLGRLWVEGHPNAELKAGWKYYLEEAQQEPEVEAQLANIREEYKAIRPEDIKVIDPCMGSGHILVYAFDVLMQIYEAAGYAQRDAAGSILEHNLYGLDIDDRAFQLAYFAVMMKARQYNRRILDGETDCHVYAIQESNGINRNHLKYLGAGLSDLECHNAQNQLNGLLDTFIDAREYGSILNVEPCSWDLLRRFAAQSSEEGQQSLDSLGLETTKEQVLQLIDIGQAMAQKYDVVVTNPPYMGAGGMGGKLSEFVKKNYPDSKADLFACFIEKGNAMAKCDCYNCMVTMQSWMFLSSFETMRKQILHTKTITNLMHMENMVMGIAFGTAVTVFRNNAVQGYKGTYNQIKMADIVDDAPVQFPNYSNRFTQTSTDNFEKIPGSPVAYWASEAYLNACATGNNIGKVAFPKTGMTTGDNNRFLRLWSEVENYKICYTALSSADASHTGAKWFPYLKGGDFRRWYGNKAYVINWYNNGSEVKNNIKPNGLKAASVRSESLYFNPLISWSAVSSGVFACRFNNGGALFDSGGSSLLVDKDGMYILALMNSKVGQYSLNLSNPTINYQPGDIAGIPVVISNKATVEKLASENTTCSKSDWDCFETSWDFTTHPLVRGETTVKEAFASWQSECNDRFNQLKSNEEELNRIFIDIYGLQRRTDS